MSWVANAVSNSQGILGIQKTTHMYGAVSMPRVMGLIVSFHNSYVEIPTPNT